MEEPPRKKLLNRWRSECGFEGQMNAEDSAKETKQYIVRIKETVRKDSSSSKTVTTRPRVSHVFNQTTFASEKSLADNVKTRIRFKLSEAVAAETAHRAPSFLTSSSMKEEEEDDDKGGLEKYLLGLSSNWQVHGKRKRRPVEGPVQSKQNSETKSEEVDGDDAIETITDDMEDCNLDSADVRKAAEIIMTMQHHYLAPKPNSPLSDSVDAAQENVAPLTVPTLNQQTQQPKRESIRPRVRLNRGRS